jgi:hypothetical protein
MTPDALDDREFYELMQAYRHHPLTPFDGVIAAYEAVKAYVRANVFNLRGNGASSGAAGDAEPLAGDAGHAPVDLAGRGVEGGIRVDEVDLGPPRLVVDEHADGVLPQGRPQAPLGAPRPLVEACAAAGSGRGEDVDDHRGLGLALPEAPRLDLCRPVEVPRDVVLDEAGQVGGRERVGSGSGPGARAAADVEPRLAGRLQVAEDPAQLAAAGCGSSGTRHASSVTDLEAWRGRCPTRLYVKTSWDAKAREVVFETCWLPGDFARYLPDFARDPNGRFFLYLPEEDTHGDNFEAAMVQVAAAFHATLT